MHRFVPHALALLCALEGVRQSTVAAERTAGNDSDWQRVQVPIPATAPTGFVWFRCRVEIPAAWQGRELRLALDSVAGAHEIHLNGARVGGAGRFPPDYQSGAESAGRYLLPPRAVRFGEMNQLALRLHTPDGRGPLHGTAPVLGTDQQHVTLAGAWEFRTGDNASWADDPATRLADSDVHRRLEPGATPAPSRGHPMADRSTPLSPAEAARTFTVPDDLELELILAEPDITQPVFLNFDERGRLWVVEYRQYPAPAGLKVVSRDLFWRAVYDRVPEPPPRGPRGLDRISIHEDTDGDGRYDRHKVFVDGLNIATSCARGRGGVWVLNPPYLLFYPDANNDDVPDGDPVVHLEGFGLEDTHSVVNSLRWGPDGWLYAAQGSTVTANVRVRAGTAATTPSRPAGLPALPEYLRRSTRPGEPPVYSQGQNIWRYHPERHIYEIFAEGGGNAFGVEFDDQGRLFSGHNGGDTRGFHYMQGAYLRKGFEKHGELSNPYAFGYFPHMEGTKGERFSHTFLIYHGGALPPRYEGKLFGCEPLQGRIVLSEITPAASTFKTRDLERVVTSSDSWFRPVDIKSGPDGAIYIADWYDRNVAHTRNQEGNMDPGNGRVYRLKKKGAKSEPAPDLARLSSADVARLLEHTNVWIRQTVLQRLRNGVNPKVEEELRERFMPFFRSSSMHRTRWHAVDFFWAWAAINRDSERVLEGSTRTGFDPSVRSWAIRILGDLDRVSPNATAFGLGLLANRETNPEVRAQLACTAKRLPAADALPIIRNLILSSRRGPNQPTGRSEAEPPSSPQPSPPAAGGEGDDTRDPRLPLLLWWALESKCETDRDAVLKLFEDSTLWHQPIVEQHLLDRLMRRFAAAGTQRDLLTCARLLALSPDADRSRILMRGFEEAFQGRSVAGLPDELITAMNRHGVGSPAFRLRRGDADAVAEALRVVRDPKADAGVRRRFIEVLGEVKTPGAAPALLHVVETPNPDTLRRAALHALQLYEDPAIGPEVAERLGAFSPEVRAAALGLLASRPAWSHVLARRVESGGLPKADVPADIVRQMKRHAAEPLATLLRQLWPGSGRPSSEAMQQQMARLNTVLREGRGDPYAGQKLFQAACASCHTLFARGGRVGPDLTPYPRSDTAAMLLHIVNPSAEIREGYENIVVETKDERSLNGFVVERDPRRVVLRGVDGQNVTVESGNIAEMTPAGLSLMPEGLLDPLTDQQVRDLFAYLRSPQPLAN